MISRMQLQERNHIRKYLQRILSTRIIRYALVGGIGIPVHLLALAEFLHLMGDSLYPLALACAFEVSTTVNFILNQFYTYSDQKHLGTWGWIKRALKAQITSLSALALTYIIALVFKYEVHVNPYIASMVGIVGVFFYNFVISKRFVFRPIALKSSDLITQAASLSQTAQISNVASSGKRHNNYGESLYMQQNEIPGQATLSEAFLTRSQSSDIMLSIVVPVMNECQNIRLLYEKISSTLERLKMRYEVVFVDDGSTDETFYELQQLHNQYPDFVSIVCFRRNFGKTPALVAGFSRCHGDVIFTMDGDLQDDPEEIPSFLAKLDEGYDLVTGWKFPRLDPLSKTFPSHIFNGLVNKLTNMSLHDINCGFKAYRREVVQDMHLKLYGEFHRFIPVIAHWRGFRVAEIKVRHHPRTFGVSKFGAKRFARGLIDLLTVLFLTSFLHTPLRLFGKLGFWSFFIGTLVDIFVVARSLFVHEPIHNQPLLFVGILFIIFGFQFILIGLLAEMIRYYAFQAGEEYSIKQEVELRNNHSLHDRLAPAEANIQQGWLHPARQPLYHQTSQDRRDQDGRILIPSRNAPRRSTIVPL